MSQPKVNILLATYNGEKFLKTQLDSLIEQTYENIDIYVRDDCSTDNTVEFIKNYIESNKSGKRIILLENNGVNLRPPKSFYQIARECEPAEYYAFCDQDDVWYPDKIKWAVEELEKKKYTNKPLVYFSAYDYYMSDGSFIRHSPEQKENIGLTDVLYCTPASGFLLVFNHEACKQFILDVDPGIEMHDRWLIRCCVCFGDTIYDKRFTASHIRHTEAVTAEDSNTIGLLKGFFQKEVFGPASVEAKQNLIYFAKVFEDRLSNEQKKKMALFIKKNGLITQIRKIFYPHALRSRVPGDIALRILFVLGRA